MFVLRLACISRASDKGQERPDDAQVWCVSSLRRERIVTYTSSISCAVEPANPLVS
jgi:hypothetical protein